MKILASDIDHHYRIEDAWREHLVPLLRAEGFKGSGRNFRRIVNQFAECISIQGSRFGGKFAINLGVQPLSIPDFAGNDVDPNKIREIDCEFRRRLSAANDDQWWSYTELKSSKILASKGAADMFRDFAIDYLMRMTGASSHLLKVDPVSFDAGTYDFCGFASTKVRMALALSMLRLAYGDKRSSQAFAKIGLASMGSAVGLKAELTKLAE